MALKFSHQRTGACEGEWPILFNEERNQASSAVALAKALYLDYVDKQATVFCLLVDQSIKCAPM